jgi:hypothetical protein
MGMKTFPLTTKSKTDTCIKKYPYKVMKKKENKKKGFAYEMEKHAINYSLV